MSLHPSLRGGVPGGRAGGWPRYFMPLRSTWLAAMSITLMMKAMAKAQMRLLRTQVWRICWLEQAAGCRESAGGHPTVPPHPAPCPRYPLGGAGRVGVAERPALTLDVDGALLGRAHVALLLRHDDVLDVLHGEVLAEGVVQQPLQLVHRQLLHVALRGEDGGVTPLPLPGRPPAPSGELPPLRAGKGAAERRWPLL